MTKTVKKRTEFHYLLTESGAVYFHSFGIQYVPQEVLNNIRDI